MKDPGLRLRGMQGDPLTSGARLLPMKGLQRTRGQFQRNGTPQWIRMSGAPRLWTGSAILVLAFLSFKTLAQSPNASSTSYVQVVNPEKASVLLGNLQQSYTGRPARVSVTTSPSDLRVTVTYSGANNAPTAAGTYAVVATVDDPNYSGSAIATLSILGTSGVTLTSNSPVMLGSPLSLAARVLVSPGTATGRVTFQEGTTLLGSSALATGRAELTTSVLAAGTHALYAIYEGDTFYPSSTSAALPITVLDYGVSVTPTTQMLTAGGSASFAVGILPTIGDSLPLATSLSVNGLPPGLVAVLSSSHWVKVSANTWTLPANTSLSGTTPVFTNASSKAQGKKNADFKEALFGLILVPFLGRRRRFFAPILYIALLTVLTAAGMLALLNLSGCTMTPALEITPATISVSAGGLKHSTSFTLDVQNR